jgi:hypothetical protein
MLSVFRRLPSGAGDYAFVRDIPLSYLAFSDTDVALGAPATAVVVCRGNTQEVDRDPEIDAILACD